MVSYGDGSLVRLTRSTFFHTATALLSALPAQHSAFSALLVISPQIGYVGIIGPDIQPMAFSTAIILGRCCCCCGFCHCWRWSPPSCCSSHVMGVSEAHGLVPRNDLWCTGPSPCTAEDLPSSSFCYACRAAQYTLFASALAARPFRAQPNILFSFTPLSSAAHLLRSPISFYAQNGCSKK